ncbi:hypothetical protein RhiirA5_440993 [Rhizophagus irregularis]|uniref:Uncharacterized protein n=1 Tax=Rhizophagus irregularis TaxID=588596 RepID=A0A2N0NG24_9GLOM|nr:hypothetical protein RhiirA5_440993 [Rhizophagus irregularis]GET52639.1 hypothetical protein RIR_jg38999.t1 [Rhizophagus irregularis DAOM 181602=DAOM 197198]
MKTRGYCKSYYYYILNTLLFILFLNNLNLINISNYPEQNNALSNLFELDFSIYLGLGCVIQDIKIIIMNWHKYADQ